MNEKFIKESQVSKGVEVVPVKRKKVKLYFRTEDDEICYPLEYWLRVAADEELKEIALFEAIPDKDKSYGWCKVFGEVLITGESECGKACSEYDPINKKSGKCRSKTYCHVWGDKKTFKVNGLVDVFPNPSA